VSKLHATLLYEKGFWYVIDHSSYGSFLYPRTVLQMKNKQPSDRVRVGDGMRVSVGGHQLLFSVVNAQLTEEDRRVMVEDRAQEEKEQGGAGA